MNWSRKHKKIHFFLNHTHTHSGAEEMAGHLRTVAGLAEDIGSVLSTQVKQLTALGTLFWNGI